MIRFFYHIVLAVVITGMISCKKEGIVNGSKGQLMGYKDSLWKFDALYTNGKINSLQDNHNSIWSFEYAENYVKATGEQSYYEYFLNNSKFLPNRIMQHYGQSYKTEINFFYKGGTNVLDSVVSTNTWSSLKTKYTFTYNVGNIEQVSAACLYPDGTVVKDSFSYTYNSTPNIFQRADPLLYIYVNPQTDLNFHNLLFYFPKVFSVATFNTFSYFQGYTRKEGKLNFETNQAGKITREWYTGYGYGYDYYYKD
jgi:hypothetical protein